MRIGKVVFQISYPVDLDNEEMVTHAKEAIWEDLSNGFKYSLAEGYIKIDSSDNLLTEDDIPDFLKEEIE